MHMRDSVSTDNDEHEAITDYFCRSFREIEYGIICKKPPQAVFLYAQPHAEEVCRRSGTWGSGE